MSVKNVVMVMTLLVGVFALVGWTLLRGIDYPLVPRPNDYMVLSAIADALLMPAALAMLRQLHCVARAGAVCVLVMISACLARSNGLKLCPRGRSS